MKTLKIMLILSILFGSIMTEVYANTSPDTIIILLSDREEIKIISNSGNELKQLSQYDINQIINELNEKAEHSEENVTIIMQDSSGTQYVLERELSEVENESESYESSREQELEDKLDRLEREIDRLNESVNEKKYEERDVKFNKKRDYGTSSTFTFEFGLNNYLNDGNFPSDDNELYAVNPLVSWYVAVGGMNSTHIAGPLSLDWGGNVSWYNFKFENERARMEKLEDGVIFYEDPTPDISPIKSKLVVPYLNVSLVPMFIFGKSNNSDWEPFSYHENDGFRIGLGVYGGYRLGPHSKAVYRDGGDRRRDKEWDSFYLNSWRFGTRLQMGFKGVDLFANYDLNELFVEGRGPQLNAFSFGIIL